jgi:putative peptide zinc metalloprotease protein
LLAFFFLPLPVSRVHETGLVGVDPEAVQGVFLPEPAVLDGMPEQVRPGQPVQLNERLGQFRSDMLEVELKKARAARDAQWEVANRLNLEAVKARNAGDTPGELRYSGEYQRERTKARSATDEVQRLEDRKRRVDLLRAPRAGVLITAPKRDEINKLFDKGYTETTPVFAVGDPGRLVVKVPVTPPDYRVLRDDLAERGQLEVSIYAKGRSDRQFHGLVRRLPAQNAGTVPLALTQRGGGSLAVKPSEDPNLLVPLAQVYLVEVEMTDPDAAIEPGHLAKVKIHAKWRSGAWWVARALANSMDLGLY